MKDVQFYETIKTLTSPEGNTIPKGTIFRSRAEPCPCGRRFGWLILPRHEEVAYLTKDDITLFEGDVVLNEDGEPVFFGTYTECAEWAHEEGLEVFPIFSYWYKPEAEDEETTPCGLCSIKCNQKKEAKHMKYCIVDPRNDKILATYDNEDQADLVVSEYNYLTAECDQVELVALTEEEYKAW